MTLRIRNWSKFQHFKDRRPPWVKLYRDLLDDPDWNALDGDSAKVITMLWLLASEDRDGEGKLPDIKTIAFRLRMKESALTSCISKLSGWLIQDDINLISERYQLGPPETETETETDLCSSSKTNGSNPPFAEFWAAYPRREAKARAEKAWNKLSAPDQTTALAALPAWPFPPDKQFIPLPASWINGRRWEDESDPGVIPPQAEGWRRFVEET